MTPPFPVEILGQHHDRRSFACGDAKLDRYFQEQVTQDVRRRATACYVTIDSVTGKVAGYYTLLAGSVALSEMPAELAKRLPRYPSMPVARLGRLAVDSAYRRRGLGALLLWDAAARAARSEMAVAALVVGARNEAAETFYRHYGFTLLSDTTRQFVLSLAGIRSLD